MAPDGAGVDDFEVVNPEDDPRYRDYWTTYHALMERRGITPPMAKTTLRTNTTVIGALMVHKGEADAVVCGTVGLFRDHYNIPLVHVDAEDMFLSGLAGETDPEKKRKFIGKAFIDLFEAMLRDRPELQEHLPAELGQLVPSFTGKGVPIPHADRLAHIGVHSQRQKGLNWIGSEAPSTSRRG